MRTDVVSITAMEMLVADMRPDNPGTWLFHCHISFHNAAGMTARYVVKDQMANE
jgi:FtsP/CotA-like multicopper oxidase with cupredoxin domain